MSVRDDRPHRRALLTAALAFLQLPPVTSALRALRAWLDNWRGVGLVIDGMRRQGYDVSLRTLGVDGGRWGASFHSDPMTTDGFAAAPTPWRAVQASARQALNRQRA